MSGTVANRMRLLRATAANLRNHHIYLNGHLDFFPAECIGPSRRAPDQTGSAFEITLDGLRTTIETDIGTDRKTGKPRGFFRGRAWVRQFFEFHGIQPGDVLAIERVAKRRYRLYPFDSKLRQADDWHVFLKDPLNGSAPTVIDLFAGAGGLALGFKRAGFRTAFANEWDSAVCGTARTNIAERFARNLAVGKCGSGDSNS